MEEEYLFNTDKYITRGVQAEVNIKVQMAMWDMVIQNKEVIKLDYLQIFRLSIKEGLLQQISIEQEVPQFKRTIIMEEDSDIIPINEKIYIIDDVTHSTMLLASEY